MEDRQAVENILRVRSSNDPKRYLGLPNMVGRRKIRIVPDFKRLN